MNSLKLKSIVAFVLLGSLINAGCNSLTKTQKGAAIGAGAGGTLGAIIGRATGSTALGAVVGGAVGGTAGAFIGRKMDRQAAEIKQTVPGATVERQGEGILVKFSSGILFDVNKTALKPDAETNLRNLATSMNNNPQTNILIVGHTDNTGSVELNQDLSVRRAEAVRNYLVSNGVNASRLSTQGKGETEPIADNTTEAGRAQNRRVEIAIAANEQMKQEARSAGQ